MGGIAGIAKTIERQLTAGGMPSLPGRAPAALEYGSVGAASAIAQATYRAMERYDAQTAKSTSEMSTSMKSLLEVARQTLAALGVESVVEIPT
jgi:hypothetical protein